VDAVDPHFPFRFPADARDVNEGLLQHGTLPSLEFYFNRKIVYLNRICYTFDPMASGKKRGRKPRILRPVEKIWLKEFSDQLSELVEKRGRSVQVMEAIAKDLQVCRASVYNYLRKTDPPMPSYSVLEQARRALRFKFRDPYFSIAPGRGSSAKRTTDAQEVLPFPLDSIRLEDVRVVGAKPVQRANALQLTVQIRFAG
jgi:hypothetical protein